MYIVFLVAASMLLCAAQTVFGVWVGWRLRERSLANRRNGDDTLQRLEMLLRLLCDVARRLDESTLRHRERINAIHQRLQTMLAGDREVTASEVAGAATQLLQAGEQFQQQLTQTRREIESGQADTLEAARDSRRDAVTGLPQAVQLDEELAESIRRRRASVALVVDIDGFRAINAAHGRSQGDRLLRRLAQQVSELAGPTAFLARSGSDELTLLVPDISVESALRLAERMRRGAAEESGRWADFGKPVTVSVGVASATPTTAHGAEPLRPAWSALLKAQSQGGNQVWWFDGATVRRGHAEQTGAADRAAEVRGPQDSADGPREALADAQGRERRRHPRRPFRGTQYVAAYDGPRDYPLGDFATIECVDISQGGLGFLMQQPPAGEDIVIGLGHPPELTMFVAKVAYVIEVEHHGERRYRVGCQFISRLERSRAQASPVTPARPAPPVHPANPALEGSLT